MKRITCKMISLFVISFMIFSCEQEPLEIADENIEVGNLPGFSIYKTKGNYFNYISFTLNADGTPNAIPDYDPRYPDLYEFYSDGRVKPKYRWYLESGYVVSGDMWHTNVFTDITVWEYYNDNKKNKVSVWMDNDRLLNRIIDKNPFTEFYWYDAYKKGTHIFTLGEINLIMKSGKAQENFEKLK